MSRLIFWRLLQMPVLLLVIYTVTFALAWMVPGNPTQMEGRKPPKEVIEALNAQYNLADPWVFYKKYLADASGVGWFGGELAELTGIDFLGDKRQKIFDMGPSLYYEDWRVSQLIGYSLPVSVQLGTAAILIALVMGVFVGVLGAVRRGGFLDFASLSLVLIGISLPTFVTGSVLLMVFVMQLQWFPIGWGGLSQIILPAFTLSLPFAAYIARLTRLGMIDVLGSDFIRTARAKGLPPGKVVYKHALKVAFLPVLSFLGPAAAGAMTGSFVIEQVFNIPGMGQHFVSAVQNKDLFLIMGVVLVYSSILIFFNLLVDVAYVFVDPRIELES